MTRINTNVSSLVAQNRLRGSNKSLNTALTRLSTGLRINTGSDDPAGLIASESLRSEITSITKSISNTNRASQIISTADSALGEVSSLLNDIRGLVIEAANSGALSDEEIAANQLQIDSSLEAINRIAQTTTFQGRKLLDGSLDFQSTASAVSSVTDVNIDQANLGTAGQVDVEVVVSSAAEQGEITAATSAFTAASAATVNSGIEFGTTTITGLNGQDLTIVGEGLTDVQFVDDTDNANEGTASFDADTGVLTITANFTGDGTGTTVDASSGTNGADNATIAAAVAALDGFTSDLDTTNAEALGAAPANVAGIAGAEGLTIRAVDSGADYNNVAINFVEGATNDASYDAEQKVLTVTVDNSAPQTAAAIETLIEGVQIDGEAIFEVDVVDDAEFAALGTADSLDTLNTGGEVLNAEVVFQLNGTTGAETFNFGAGTSIDQIASAINLVSDATGVQATATESAGLDLTTTAYGSNARVAIEVISEGTGGTFENAFSTTSDTGADIVATVNGVEASGDGNALSINTATLDLSLTVTEGSSSNFSFSINGGGARFQLGPDAVSTQQASIGIGSVSTGQLGGAAGRLYELGSGQSKSLTNDVSGASNVIDEVITKINSLRGRLGAFQSTTLESNLASLNNAKANLSEAESSIRDADFAEESANLTRAQILVQSGTNVLSLANQQPQNVLALLR